MHPLSQPEHHGKNGIRYQNAASERYWEKCAIGYVICFGIPIEESRLVGTEPHNCHIHLILYVPAMDHDPHIHQQNKHIIHLQFEPRNEHQISACYNNKNRGLFLI